MQSSVWRKGAKYLHRHYPKGDNMANNCRRGHQRKEYWAQSVIPAKQLTWIQFKLLSIALLCEKNWNSQKQSPPKNSCSFSHSIIKNFWNIIIYLSVREIKNIHPHKTYLCAFINFLHNFHALERSQVFTNW